MLDESITDCRIEKSSRSLTQQFKRPLARHAGSERPIFPHRIEAIHDRHDSRRDGNLLALQSVRITPSIPALVMMFADGDHGKRKVHPPQMSCASHEITF